MPSLPQLVGPMQARVAQKRGKTIPMHIAKLQLYCALKLALSCAFFLALSRTTFYSALTETLVGPVPTKRKELSCFERWVSRRSKFTP